MITSRTIKTLSMLVVASLVVTACSTGDASDTTTTTSADPDTTTPQATGADAMAFCQGYARVSALISQGPGDDADPSAWAVEVSDDLATVKEQAPEAISAPVGQMVDALLGPLSTLDEDAFDQVTSSPEFESDSQAITAFLTDDCGFGKVDVIAVNYAYQGDLADIVPGYNAMTLDNEGTEVHEMVLVRFNDDTEGIQDLLALPEDEAFTTANVVGFAIASPGDSTTVYADLEPGRYAIFCALPVGATSFQDLATADGPPHFTKGMAREFSVGNSG